MGKLSNADIEKILSLNEEGLHNREIAREMDVHHGTIAYWLEKNGRSSSFVNQPIDRVSDTEARCSRCDEIKDINEFQYGRKGQKYEYKFSYCNECRRKQIRLNLNSDPKKALKDRYNRMKRSAKVRDIPFTLSFDYYYNLFEKQNRKCFYTDVELDWYYGNGKNFKYDLSLDKVIPELGYVEGNVVMATTRVNTAKNNFSLSEMKLYMPEWYRRLVESEYIKVAPGDF